jgi:hypothetical protein
LKSRRTERSRVALPRSPSAAGARAQEPARVANRRSSMASYAAPVLGRPGAICRRSTASGWRSISASDDGARPAHLRSGRHDPRQAMAENSRHSLDSMTVHDLVSAAGAKEGLANKLLAAREPGSPVKFIVSAMPRGVPPVFHLTNCTAFEEETALARGAARLSFSPRRATIPTPSAQPE